MQTRATFAHSCREKMNASIAFLLCAVLANAVGYNLQRDAPYDFGPNNLQYAVPLESNYYLQEPSQRLFWSNGNGSNQVGGTGLWATLTNKFPFLANMFGRMQLPPQQYTGGQYDISQQYGAAVGYQPPLQFYQGQPFYQPQQAAVPFARDVGFTDDAVIVTPPQVPVFPQPIPQPAPAPAPQPAPAPSPGGYRYDKPKYRLELPHK